MMSRILAIFFFVALIQPLQFCNGEVPEVIRSSSLKSHSDSEIDDLEGGPGKVGILIDQSRSKDLRVSIRAITALGFIYPTKKEIVRALTLLTKSSSPTIRFQAVASLGQIGKGARSALPNLESIARSGNGPIARKAAEAVTLIDERKKLLVDEPEARAALFTADQNSSTPDLDPVQKLSETAASTATGKEEESETVRLAKIKSIDVSVPSQERSKLLIDALKDTSAAVKTESLLKLSKNTESSQEEAEAVESTLTDSDSEVRETAFKTLTKMGAEGMRAMVNACTSVDLSTKIKAIKALRSFDRTLSTEAVIQLKQNLSDANESVRAQSAVTLGMANSLPHETIPLLIRSLEGDDLSAAVPATVALSKFNSDAVEQLAFALDSHNPKVRSRAATAFGLMEPAPEEVEALLTPLLSDESPEVRASAKQALQSIAASKNQEEE